MPGIALIVATVPSSGELELTLGVFGIMLTIVGSLFGAALAAAVGRRDSRRPPR